MTEFGDSLSSEERRSAQRTLTEGESAARSDDPDEVRRATEEVEMLGLQITNAMINSPVGGASNIDEG
jgi:hypothetical protein